MEFEFDPEKAALKWRKHGISLRRGVEVLGNLVARHEDDRFDYGEIRINAIGRIQGHPFVLTYTLREDRYRFISLRRATKEERTRWL